MKRFKLFLVLLLAIAFVVPAQAATNIYSDTYTTEDSTGTWTFTNYNSSGFNRDTEFIDDSGDTSGTVTAAKTGYHYIYRGTGAAVGGNGITLTLPTAADGLTYKFSTHTGRTVSVRSASASDVFVYGFNTGATRFTSPATTGSTITVVGNTNAWYVTEMITPAVAGTNSRDDWTAGSR